MGTTNQLGYKSPETLSELRNKNHLPVVDEEDLRTSRGGRRKGRGVGGGSAPAPPPQGQLIAAHFVRHIRGKLGSVSIEIFEEERASSIYWLQCFGLHTTKYPTKFASISGSLFHIQKNLGVGSGVP